MQSGVRGSRPAVERGIFATKRSKAGFAVPVSVEERRFFATQTKPKAGFAVPASAVEREFFAAQIFFNYTKKGQAPKHPPLSISYYTQISRYPEPS